MTDKQQEAKAKLLEFIQLIKDGAFDDELKKESETLYNDWRLPTAQELLTLVNYEKHNPPCDLEDTVTNFYWSSSSFVSDSSFAWVVSSGYGDSNCNLKSNSNLVRCVRTGENGLEWSATSDIKMTWDEATEYAKNLVAPVYYKEKQCLK